MLYDVSVNSSKEVLVELKHSDFKFGYSNESELEVLKTLGIDLSSSINLLPVRKQKFVNKSIESSTT